MNYKEYKQALRGTLSISPCYKIEILDEMENPKQEITSDILANGNVSVKNNNGIRRTATLTLYNGHNKYKIAPNHIFYGMKLNLYAGIKTDAGEYYEKLGIFYIQKIGRNNAPNDKNITLTLVDKWAKLDGTIFGKIPSKVAYNKTVTVYRNSNKTFLGAENKKINQSVMLSSDFVLDSNVTFTDATEGINNNISLPGSFPGINSKMTTIFTLNGCRLSFKGGELSETLALGNLTVRFENGEKWIKIYFLEGSSSSIEFSSSENTEVKKVQYDENLFKTDKSIDFIIQGDMIQILYDGNEAFKEKNFLNEFKIVIMGYSSTIKELVMVGSFEQYYDYNMYDIIRNTLKKNCRYDVRIIDYLPSTVLDFNPKNEAELKEINKLINTRVGGIGTIRANYDFIQLTSNNKIFRCISNNWNETLGVYDTKWEEYFVNSNDVLDNSEPILDSYYEPIYQNGKVVIDSERYSVEQLPYGKLTLPKSIVQEVGGTESQILLNIAELLSAEMGYNRHGQLTCKPTDREIDYQKQEVIWRFKKKDYFFNSTETIDYSGLVNYVVVTGTTDEGVEITEAVGNENLESEYCIQKIGTLPYIYKVAYTYNLKDWVPESAKQLSEEEQKAKAKEEVRKTMKELAEWYLKRNNTLQNSVEISSYMIPHMEENKIIELENEYGLYDKYIVNSFSIPLDYSGSMSINCTKVI